jgi:HEAT repeats
VLGGRVSPEQVMSHELQTAIRGLRSGDDSHPPAALASWMAVTVDALPPARRRTEIDEEREKRYFAVFQLGELALRGATLAPVIIDALLAGAHDHEAAVRAQVAHTLDKLKPSDRAHPGVQMALERLIKDESAEVRERAEAALRKKEEE